MENFTQIENTIFDAQMRLPARFLWIVIRSFENKQHDGWCFAPIATIAERAGDGWDIRRVQRVWRELIEKGYGCEKIQTGRVTLRRVTFPDTPVTQTTPVSETPGSVDTPVTQATVSVSAAPVTQTTHKILSKIYTEKKEEQEPASPPPPDKRKPIIKDPEKLKEALSAINISELISEFEPKGIDVAAVYDRFCDRVIGDQNPQNYRDFKRALRRWLSYEVDKVTKRNGKPPPKEPEWMK
jgi:hypothetical protein